MAQAFTNKENLHAINKLFIEEIESGKFKTWVRPWHPTLEVPLNAQHKPYGPTNQFILSAAHRDGGYTLSFWVTERKGKQLGGWLNSEQKPTMIFTNKPQFVTKEKDENGNDKWYSTQRPGTKKVWRVKPVFLYNIEQFSWRQFPEEYDVLPKPNVEIAESAIIETVHKYAAEYLSKYSIPINHGGSSAFYSIGKDEITLPKAEAFTSRRGYAETYIHELIHSTGHKTRLNRFMKEHKRGTNQYAFEEMVAELTTHQVLHDLKIPFTKKDMENMASYIIGWVPELKKNLSLLNKADGCSRKAKHLIESANEKPTIKTLLQKIGDRP